MKETSKRLILLDAHAILHRAYHALPDFATSKGEPTGALYGLSTMVIKIIEDLKPDYIVACYDLKGPTYRHEIYKEYKAGRQKTDDDLIIQINRSQDVFKALNIPIYSKEGFEADDIIGTIVEQVKKEAGRKKQEENKIEVIIASGDMDTMQLIDGTDVKVYTLKKGIKDTIMYDEDAVVERFGFGPKLIPDYKGLRGDPSDNIPGIKGIGEKSGTSLIVAFGTIENMYIELEKGNEKAFTKAGMTPRLIQLLKDNKEEAEFSKMLAIIRRDAPINFIIPEKPFKDNLDLKKVSAFWNELEFRTLLPRLEKAVHGKPAELFGDIEEKKKEEIDPAELEKTALALWVVTSHITNPTLDDIYAFAHTEKFADASKVIFTELDKRNVRNVYKDIELPLIPIVHKMEKRGVKIDKKLLNELSKKYHTALADLEKKIWELAVGERIIFLFAVIS